MTPEKYQQVKAIYQAALESSPEEWQALVAEACNGDEELKREVESLLSFRDEAKGFIETSAFQAGVGLIAHVQNERFEEKSIDRYKLLAEIGRGGMGVVYRAARADDQFRKQVAIKIVRRGLDTEETRRRFLHERQILATLEHSNIARLL